MKNYNYIIFDFDGTLVDSMWLWEEVDVEFLARRGCKPDECTREKVKTLNLEESAQFFIEYFGIADTINEICDEILERATEKYKNYVKLKPAVKEMLQQFTERGKRLCIATISDRVNVESVLKKYDIDKYFEFVLTSEDVSKGKTNPEIFLKCAEKFEASPSDICVFEDSYHAICTAKNAGFYVVAVRDKTASAESDKINRIADEFIEGFTELL